MPFSTAIRNAWLDGLGINYMRIHSGDPGAAGTANVMATAPAASGFATASNGSAALAADVPFTGVATATNITHFSVWTGDPASAGVFKGSGTRTGGDAQANAGGQYTLTQATTLTIT